MKEIREINGVVRAFDKDSFTDWVTGKKVLRSMLRVSYKESPDDLIYESLILGKIFETQAEFDAEPVMEWPRENCRLAPITIAEIEKDDKINCYRTMGADEDLNYFLKDRYFIVKEYSHVNK